MAAKDEDVNITYKSFLFFDTNILSELAADNSLVRPLFDYLTTKDYCIGFTGINLVELSDAFRKHDTLTDILLSLPSALIKGSDQILDEEIQSFPAPRNSPLMLTPLNHLLGEPNGRQTVRRQFAAKNTAKARSIMLQDANRMKEVLQQRLGNFPPARVNGRTVYTWDQATSFADLIIRQWLRRTVPEIDSAPADSLKVFKTVRSYAMAVFSKYYVDRERPKQSSDFGDLFMAMQLPYFNGAIVERNLREHFRKIREKSDVLTHLDLLENVTFVRQLK